MQRWMLAVTATAMSVGSSMCWADGLKILYEFQGGPDGKNPVAGLIAYNGLLFGTTPEGGGTGCQGLGCGTVFTLDISTQAETVLYRFAGSPDAAAPEAPLLLRGPRLFGTSVEGGTVQPGKGAVFAVNQHSGHETVLDSFGPTTGEQVMTGLVSGPGGLFGTAELAGQNGDGTIYKIDSKTGSLQVAYAFAGAPNDGASPEAGLIVHAGMLYGTTVSGGSSTNCGAQGCGTVFKLNPMTDQETVLYNFQDRNDGAEPGTLIYSQGSLYGVAGTGGIANCLELGCGTLFRFDLKTGRFSVLHEFMGGKTDGGFPFGLLEMDGILYGTTSAGGKKNEACYLGCGTLFKFDLTAKVEMVLHFFRGVDDGQGPNPVVAYDGVLYGTTLEGGATPCDGGSGCGVVFAYKP